MRFCASNTGPKYRNVNRHLESGIAGTCGVRNERYESAIVVIGRYADDHRRPDFGRHAEVDKPDLASLRRLHYLLLVSIELDKEAICSSHQVVFLREIVRGERGTPKQFRDKLCPVLLRQRVEFVEQLLASLRHATRLAPSVRDVKRRC